jgi:hypothetical protein
VTQEERDRQIGVHRTHCCLKHGCKYGKKDCPVVWKSVKQEYRCEYCDGEWRENGRPHCSIKSCDSPGYWNWIGSILQNWFIASDTEVKIILCDDHDRYYRVNKTWPIKPVEERVL